MKIALIGCGNLGLSILNGIIDNSSVAKQDIYVTKRNPQSILHYKN